MNLDDWIVEKRGNQTNFFHKDHQTGDDKFFIVQEIPNVDVKTLEHKGNTYSLKMLRKGSHWKRFRTMDDAIKYAIKNIEKHERSK